MMIEKIQKWLNTEPSQRDITEGAELLLRIDRNRIAYRNATLFPDRYASHLEYQLKKYLMFMLDRMTHEKVQQLTAEAGAAAERNVDVSAVPPEAIRRGLRPDHASLPQEVQQLYEQAMATRRRISECHMQARRVMESHVVCKDSELYPWVKEIIELDKKAHALFRQYDSFSPENSEPDGEC